MTNIKLIIFCVLSAFLSGGNSLCVDKNALNTVNATVRKTTLESGIKVFNKNFYLLDNYTFIDVINANVTELCEGMIKNFPNLNMLSLINVNLSKIDPNAFQKVPKLKSLSLAVNNLTEIVKGSFDNLQSLEILYLSSNEIQSIESGTFDNMSNLRAIHLDRNKIKEINGNLFSGCPKIRLIRFGFNAIAKITKISFQDLKPDNDGPITIYLNKNIIDDIDAAAFDLSNPVYLHLESNLITSLSDLFHGVRENSKLYLNKNQLACIPDDVIENMKTTSKEVYLLENPLVCECVDRIDEMLGEDEMHGNGRIVYNSTFPCQFFNDNTPKRPTVGVIWNE